MRLLTLFIVLALPGLAVAQERPGASGVLRITEWPEQRSGGWQAERELQQYDILPYIDTLTVGYRFERINGQPVAALAAEWKPGRSGILDGRKVRYDQLPDSLFMTEAALQTDVYVDGQQVATMNLRLDSMQLGPYPDVHAPEPRLLYWEGLFKDVPAERARAYFERGFELRNPRLVAAAFETHGEQGAYAKARPRVGRPRPSRRSVIIVDNSPDILIDLVWLGRGWDRVDSDAPRKPRGGRVGRGGTDNEREGRVPSIRGTRSERGNDAGTEADPDATRTGDGQVAPDGGDEQKPRRTSRKPDLTPSSDSDDEDDEDDDEKELLPAALTAVAAVGVLAYAGGTVGYFGSPKHAPLGATAGMVRPSGGFLLQAGVNEAVLGESGPEHLLAKLVAFHSVLPIPVQPAVGAGVLVVRENEQTRYEPSFSLGAVGNFGPIILFGAYDVTLTGFELGAAFNFRSKPRRTDLP